MVPLLLLPNGMAISVEYFSLSLLAISINEHNIDHSGLHLSISDGHLITRNSFKRSSFSKRPATLSKRLNLLFNVFMSLIIVLTFVFFPNDTKYFGVAADIFVDLFNIVIQVLFGYQPCFCIPKFS